MLEQTNKQTKHIWHHCYCIYFGGWGLLKENNWFLLLDRDPGICALCLCAHVMFAGRMTSEQHFRAKCDSVRLYIQAQLWELMGLGPIPQNVLLETLAYNSIVKKGWLPIKTRVK